MCNCGLHAHCFFWLVCAKEKPHFNCVLVPHADVQGDKLNVTCITGPTSPFASSSVVKASRILVRYQIFMNAKCRPAVHLNDAAFLYLCLDLFISFYWRVRAPQRAFRRLGAASHRLAFLLWRSHTRMWWYVGLHLWDAAAARTSASWLRRLLRGLDRRSLSSARRAVRSEERRLHFFYFVGWFDFRLLSSFFFFFYLRPFNVTALESRGCPLADVIHTIVLSCRLGSALKKKKKKSHLILPAWWFTLTWWRELLSHRGLNHAQEYCLQEKRG